MPRIFTIGQSVFDILFRNNEPFTAKVGGSMLNTSVSLGRLGMDVYFIGEYGNDFAGNITNDFLRQNNVKTNYVYRFNDGQTTISLAFLDKDNNAAYNFYRNMPEKRLEIIFPEIRQNDIILFGSFYIFDPAIKEILITFLNQAKQAGAILMYDPNFRKPHYSQIDKLRPQFMQYFTLADIVRGSNEDFYGIFNVKTFDELLTMFPNKEALLIYTSAREGVHMTNGRNKHFMETPVIKPVSTIGAGDTFNAGIIYGIIDGQVSREELRHLNDNTIGKIVNTAISFATHVCMSEDNYLSHGFCKNFIATRA